MATPKAKKVQFLGTGRRKESISYKRERKSFQICDSQCLALYASIKEGSALSKERNEHNSN